MITVLLSKISSQELKFQQQITLRVEFAYFCWVVRRISYSVLKFIDLIFEVRGRSGVGFGLIAGVEK